MKYLAIPACLAVFPASATAAEYPAGDGGGFSFVSSFLQMAASLAVVIGVILLFHYLSKKWLKGPIQGNSRSGYIRVVESRFLAPKKSLLLVEVSGEYMLLSNCGDNINLIKQIDMIEEVEVVGEASSVTFRDALQDRLKGLAARLPAGCGAFSSALRKSGVRP